uniref:Ankyrin repeat protein n=1 Tax=Trichogramma kaykai TaxID=54128 RepID=A0ABD2WDV2_9HYME
MSSVSKKDKCKRLDKQKGTIQLYERLNYLCRHNPYDFEQVQKRLGQTLTPQEINEIIYWSVKKNRIHIIEFLVETYEVKLMPIDKTGQTVIHMAERKDFSEAVEKLMLKTCLDENRCDSNGLSYLQIACLKGMYDIVKKFIDMGVDANLSLDHAMIKGIVDCSNKYHGKGKVQDLDGDIDPEIPEIKSIKIFELLLKCGANPNVDPDDGRNALHKLITMTYNREPSPIIFHGSGGPYAGRYYIATRNIG